MVIKTTKSEACVKLGRSDIQPNTDKRLKRLCPCCKTRDLYHYYGQVEHIQCYSCCATWFKTFPRKSAA